MVERSGEGKVSDGYRSPSRVTVSLREAADSRNTEIAG